MNRVKQNKTEKHIWQQKQKCEAKRNLIKAINTAWCCGCHCGVISVETHKGEAGEQKAAPQGLMLKLPPDERPHLTGQP